MENIEEQHYFCYPVLTLEKLKTQSVYVERPPYNSASAVTIGTIMYSNEHINKPVNL